MKKILISLKMLFIIGVLTVGLNACEKENIQTQTPTGVSDMSNTDMTHISDMSGPESVAMLDQNTNEISTIVDEAYANSNGDPANRTSGENSTAYISKCANIIVDMNASPRSITVDFGTTNCLGKDGHYRRGKIIATFTGEYRAEGSMLNFITVDYFVDNNRVDARAAMTNMGRNDKGFLHFSIEVQATVTLANPARTSLTFPGTITFSSNRDQVWIAGEATVNRTDDIYLVSGTTRIKNDKNVEFQSEVTVPLRKEIGYPYYIWGVEKISRVPTSEEAGFTVTLDYGYPKGGRDNLALLTFSNGTTKVIHLQ